MNSFRIRMSTCKIALMIMLGTGILANFAVAAGIGELCSGSISLAEGQWARFAVDAPFMKDRLESRYAVVGMEGSDYWIEYEIAMPMGNGTTIMKVPDSGLAECGRSSEARNDAAPNG